MTKAKSIEAGLPVFHWEPRPPDHSLCWSIGDRYPRHIIITYYEENQHGVRRNVESKVLTITDEQPAEPDYNTALRRQLITGPINYAMGYLEKIGHADSDAYDQLKRALKEVGK